MVPGGYSIVLHSRPTFQGVLTIGFSFSEAAKGDTSTVMVEYLEEYLKILVVAKLS